MRQWPSGSRLCIPRLRLGDQQERFDVGIESLRGSSLADYRLVEEDAGAITCPSMLSRCI